jgi:hypothetical protein
MDVGAALIADLEPSKAVEPGQRPLDHPPIASQPLTRLDAAPSDARDDTPSAQRSTAARVIIPLSACNFTGRRRGRPRRLPGRRSGGIASTVTSSRCESWTLAPEMVTANGTPERSTTM